MKAKLLAAGRYLLAAGGRLVLACLLGVVCGVLGTGFHHLIDLATHYRQGHPWLLLLLPAGGLAILGLYKLCRVSYDAGTNLVLTSVDHRQADPAPIPLALAPLIVAGTTLSHLLGASVGREGAALQLGGSIGHNAAKALRLEAKDVRLCAMCGMAGCFAAMFGTPLAAAVFVVEVVRVGIMRYGALLPCLAASYAAHLTAHALGAEPMAFALTGQVAPTAGGLLRVAGLAALCAAVSILFCVALEGGSHLAKHYLKNPYLRIALGGAVMAALVIGLNLYDYAGAGTPMIHQAAAGQADPWAFAVKIALTALCVAAGYRGGEIVPTLFIGATFGCAAAPLLGLDPSFGAGIGMIALFCAVVNCPLASLCLAAELFAAPDLAPFAVAVAVAYVLSGPFGLYTSQSFHFSKVADVEV